VEELVQLVGQRTGLPEPQARLAVETVVGFLKSRLPAPIAGQVDAVLSGQGSTLAGMLGSVLPGGGGGQGGQQK
jgi:hypothetical protein